MPLSARAFETARTSPTKICGERQLNSCFEAVETVNSQFILDHGRKTPFVAVLFHGLTDSPYYFKDVARLIFNQGINVIGIKLSGHGTRPEDLHEISLDDWKDDAQFGFELGLKYGSKFLLGGFSAGGALAVHSASLEPSLVRGIFLFSPALKIRDAKAPFTCLPISWIGEWVDPYMPEDTPIRYRNMSTNGVCQLFKLTYEIRSDQEAWQTLHQPVFTVLTEYDGTVDISQALLFAASIPSVASRTLFYRKPLGQREPIGILPTDLVQIETSVVISHASIPLQTNPFLPEYNPLFDRMAAELTGFLETHFKADISAP